MVKIATFVLCNGEVGRIGGKRKVELESVGLSDDSAEIRDGNRLRFIHPSPTPVPPLSRQNIAQTIFLSQTPVFAPSTHFYVC